MVSGNSYKVRVGGLADGEFGTATGQVGRVSVVISTGVSPRNRPDPPGLIWRRRY